MKLRIYTDGGSKGNPGPSAIGIVCFDDAKKEIFRHRDDIGVATNNKAEYQAVVTALELVRDKTDSFPSKIEKVDFYSDSQLLVNQLNGTYKIKKAHIRDFVFKIRILESELRIPIYYHHVMREKNKLADALVNDEV